MTRPKVGTRLEGRTGWCEVTAVGAADVAITVHGRAGRPSTATVPIREWPSFVADLQPARPSR